MTILDIYSLEQIDNYLIARRSQDREVRKRAARRHAWRKMSLQLPSLNESWTPEMVWQETEDTRWRRQGSFVVRPAFWNVP